MASSENTTSRQYTADLATILAELRPQSLLCIGSACPESATGCACRHIRFDQLEMLSALGRFDLALVSGGWERLAKPEGQHLLARLRDLHGGRFLLLLPISPNSPWQHNELLAYGLVHLASYPDQRPPLELYQFNLDDYKTTPDWLNSRFWANPERWDSDFW